VTFLPASKRTRRDVDGLAVVLAGAAAGYGGDRRRPVTGGAVRGSRRAVGLASEGRGEAAAPQRRDPRVEPWPLTAGHPGRSSLSTARARPRCSRPGPSGPARRRCALDDREENPHSTDVMAVGSTGSGQVTVTQVSRIAPRWCGWFDLRRCPTRRRRRERCRVRGAASDRSFPGSRDRHCLEPLSARGGPG
jgi:hypothetical protein